MWPVKLYNPSVDQHKKKKECVYWVVSDRRREKVTEKPCWQCPPDVPSATHHRKYPHANGRASLRTELEGRGQETDSQCCFWRTKPAGIPAAIEHSLGRRSDCMFSKQVFDPFAVGLHGENALTVWLLLCPFPFDNDLSHKTNRAFQ